MKWLRHRTAGTVGLLAVGMTLLLLGWHQKRGYVDPVAAGARATEEGRFDNRDFERAEGNLFASRELLAYNRGVRAAAAGELPLAARHFEEVIARGHSPSLQAKAFYNLGNLLALKGKPREAARMYREALRLDPSDWDAKSNLEMLYNHQEVSVEEKSNAGLTQAQEPRQAAGEEGGSGPRSGNAGI